MNKKIKKLIKNPSLFLNDMIAKRRRIRFSTPSGAENFRFKYNIVVVTSSVAGDCRPCLDSIHAQSIGAKFNVITLNQDDEKCQVSTYGDENNYVSCRLDEALHHEYTLFVWGEDTLDANFIQQADRVLKSSKSESNILLTNKFKLDVLSQVPRVYHPLTAIYNKVSPYNVSPSLIAVDSIYGTFFSTSAVKRYLEMQSDYGWMIFDGIGLLFDVLSKEKEGTSICIAKTAKYLVDEESSSKPFSGADWSQTTLYGNEFKYLIDSVEDRLFSHHSDSALIKRSLFFFLLKYIKKGVTNQSLLDGCSAQEKIEFKHSFARALGITGNEAIEGFNIACAEQFKVGALNKIGAERFVGVIDVLQYDEVKNEVLLRYYSQRSCSESFRCESGEMVPNEAKTVSHFLFNELFFYERRVWLCLKEMKAESPLAINIDNVRMKFKGLNKKIIPALSLANIISQNNQLKPAFKMNRKYRNAWVLMDRDNQADDNAEHLYRYIKEHHPDIPAYFVISSDSHDWHRLESEGFNLLAFGSSEHEAALESCSRVISSHAAQFATDYFKDKRMLWKKFVFLQHGVIHNDQSALFKPDWKKFDLFLTSSTAEYQSIAGDESTYKFTPKEVALTGLPRHDALIRSDIKKEKMILVMPTWRPSLLGKVIEGTTRELLSDFTESEYAARWRDLLGNEQLKRFAEQAGYEIVFFPHANIQPYLGEYRLPEHVKVLDHAAGSIQELFLQASLMITDYSSVAFEMAYLCKPVCYYQFDEEDFFKKGHYNKGYFDYRGDGFGPVLTHEDEIFDFVKDSISNNCEIHPPYAERAEEFFPYRDGKCCERTLDAILSLDDRVTHAPTIDAFHWAERAISEGNLCKAAERYKHAFASLASEDTPGIASRHYHNYCHVLQHSGDWNTSGRIIEALEYNSEDITGFIEKSAVILSLANLQPVNVETKITLSKECVSFIDSFLNTNDLDDLSSLHPESPNDSLYSLLNENVFLLRMHEKKKEYINAILHYNGMCRQEKEFIVNKSIYIRSLRALNKWSLIIKIANTPILQGRTGISCLASAYFYSLRASKKIASRGQDFEYLATNARNLDPAIVSDIINYYYFVKDYKNVDMILEYHLSIAAPGLLEKYCELLCRAKRVDYAYSILNSIPFEQLSINGLILLGEMSLLRDEYECSISAFKRASMLQLPKVDKNIEQRLNYVLSCEREYYSRKELLN